MEEEFMTRTACCGRPYAVGIVMTVLFAVVGFSGRAHGFVNSAEVGTNDSGHQIPNDMKFEPRWRERGDCGPISLYVLMRLSDRKVSLEGVKRVLSFDPEIGCSLADVARAADALGFATELCFVNPKDLPTTSFPFILHQTGSLQRGIGHFAVVVGYSPETHLYSAIDTTYEQFHRVTEGALLSGFSGYVLVPKRDEGGMSRAMFGGILVCEGGFLAALAFFAPWLRRTIGVPRASLSEANRIVSRGL
jgi:hypothetical protein